ncbi:MAG: hypothetical protein ACRD88_05090 [Terriglobia bacterium]
MKATDTLTASAVTISSDTSVREIALPPLPTKEIVMKPLTLKRSVLTASILAGFLIPAYPVWAQHSQHVVVAQAPGVASVAEASSAQRDLWVGHIFWVRNVVVETFAGNKQAAVAAEKEVVANARQIAAAIEPYYGKAASDKLFGLLAGHYGAVKEYLVATTAGSKAKQDAAIKNLTANATEIAKFLSGANPNLPFDTLNGLLLGHGGHHIQQIQQFTGKQYAQEAQTWEAMKKHMYVIADALAGAIAKQFPAKFS